MRYRKFGPTGREVAVVGQGSWPLPDVAALRRGIELGMTHIDTAEMYGEGRSEELVGEAIRGFDRDSLFLVSKVMPHHGRRADVHRACDASLKRLGIDVFDCYLLHWRGDLDLAETMVALEELVHAGKTRSIGVSNLDPWDLREATSALPTVPIVCNQVMYNLAERTVEEHEYPWAEEHGQAFVAYTPLGGIPESGPARQLFDELAKKYEASVPAIALAFLLRLPNVFVIPKAARLEHVEENARAADIELESSDIVRIEAVFPRRQRVGPLPMN